MKKDSFKFGDIEIEASAYGSQGNAILGIRDSGKTYTAMFMAEKLFEAGIPFVAFDPIGVWRFLRVPGKGKGYPVVVAGGNEGDLPLTVAGAPEIMRAAMRSGVSLVIDLFDIKLSKADWKRIVTSCVKVLLHENKGKGLRHIFIEEAAEFAPQRPGPDQAQVYAEIEKLARMGGNSGLGYTLINQRSEEVAKAVLELCDNLFLHRQKGKNSLNSLSKWLDVGNVKEFKEIIASLSTLPTGECWAWMQGDEEPELIKVPAKNSLHPDRRIMRGEMAAKAKAAVNVKSFVSDMKTSLAAVEKEAAQNDPDKLRKRVTELEAALRKPGAKPKAEPDLKAIAASREEGRKAGYALGYEEGFEECRADALADMKKVETALISRKFKAKIPKTPHNHHAPIVAPETGGTPRQILGKEERLNLTPRVDGITRPQQAVLDALAFWKSAGHETPERVQVAAVAGYSPRSSTFGGIISSLNVAGLASYPTRGTLALTLEGEACAVAENNPKEKLLSILTGPQKIIAETLESGDELTREDVAERSGYSLTSSTFGGLLSGLSVLGILEYPSRGSVKMSAWAREILG